MGQQQLLLLVLGIVIVGLAVVVGINAFSENNIKSNADALVTDGLRIASDIQAWALKPTQFGGGGGDASLSSATFPDIGYPVSTTGDCGADDYQNVNGCFSLDAAAACTTAPDATDGSATATTIFVNATNAQTDNTVCVVIEGTRSDNIDSEVEYGT